MALPLFVGAGGEQRGGGVVDPHEGKHQPRGVVGRQLGEQDDLPGHRHSTSPFLGPVRRGKTGEPQLLEPGLLERDKLHFGHAGLRLTPSPRDVVDAPLSDLGAKLSSSASGVDCSAGEFGRAGHR